MGKSTKKNKNDRINMLRKQYDAFLEEDKKRRERNDYILGKLDKMRSPTALVRSDVYMPPNNLRIKPDAYDNYVPCLERKHMDESVILNEISKRYILIPKRPILMENVYTYRKEAIDDKDWKNKYNILDDLKKQEKGEHLDTALYSNNEITMQSSEKDSEPTINHKKSHNMDNEIQQPDTQPNQENVDKLNTYEQRIKVNKTIKFEDSQTNNHTDEFDKIPVQTVSISSNEGLKINDTKSTLNTNLTDESLKHSIIETFQEKHDSDSNEKSKMLAYHQAHNDENNFLTNVENNSNDDNNQVIFQESVDQSYYNDLPAETSNYVAHENISDASYCEQIVSNSAVQEPVSSYTDQLQSPDNPQEQSATQFLDQNINKNNQIQKDVINEIGDIPSTEKGESDVKESNFEGQLQSNQTPYDVTEHYETVQESISIENTEHTALVDHDSEIRTFEDEQKEMFYSEQTGGDTYMYNQEDNNTGGYTGEDYPQSDQYAYYEGVEQGQAYATNINEHEESTERYDPHYDQQYDNSYEIQHTDKTIDENTNEYSQPQFQDGTYENEKFENVNYEKQQYSANLYQENDNNENAVQENVIAHDNQIYNQQLYTEEPDTHEDIEQQLTLEEGVPQNISLNVGESLNKNEAEAKTNKWNMEYVPLEVRTPVEHIPDPS